MKKYALEVKNLKKSFDGGQKFVLNGVNLEVEEGQLVAIIGFSGTGKSVLLKHILGFLKPTSGEVYVLGENIHEKNYSDLIDFRYNLGVLFQNVALFDDMSVIDNVLFPLNEHRKEVSLEDRRALAEGKLALVEIFPRDYSKTPSEISGGMQKRVGLARTLVMNPQIILYDEPTTGLDPILCQSVDKLILKTHKSFKKMTSIFITHDLRAAFTMADYVIMLDKGTVLFAGAPAEFETSTDETVRRFLKVGLHR